MPYDLRPVVITPGVASTEDFTPQSTTHWTFSQGVRFVDGFPEKIGGWTILPLSGNFVINGASRMVFSYSLSNNLYYLIGTSSNLYVVFNNTLYNVTPVDTATNTYNNILGTFYGTLTANPFQVILGSATITVEDAGHPFLTGDNVEYSGSTDVANIPAAQINTVQTVQYVDANHYSFTVGTTSNATTTGGGASVVRTSKLVSVVESNTYNDGDNIVVSALGSSVGGIATGDIEGIRIVRNVTPTGYNITADDYATSSASSAGGSVTIAPPIPPGQVSSTVGFGYGLGLYGVGLYGVGTAATSPTLPRIWSADRFGNYVIATPGQQTGLYSWDNTTSTIAEPVLNAPTAINYCFVSDNIAVTLGASNTPNRIKWCDQGNLTVWTATSQNQAGEDDIEGAAQFISHAPMQGFNLLFTGSQVYSFRYIGAPFVWQTQLIETGKGLIAQNARIVVNGVAYWMGLQNWYWYNGGNIDIVPSNTTNQSTIRKYIYNNLNWGQVSKIFCWYNADFNEICWHVPTGDSVEPNTVVRFNILDRTWCMDSADRTAAEYPAVQGLFPYIIDTDNNILQYENGYDDNTESLPFACYGPYFSTNSSRIANLGGVYPDNIVSLGTISMGLNFKRYPAQIAGSVNYDINSQGAFSSGFDAGFQVGNGTLNLTYRKNCRYWQYAVSGDVLGQYWRAGQWMELYMLTKGWR